ncbi:hypothetical protein CRI93_10925 [Longimonas halophila]|uniref:Transferrin-binding protein B C-lobe/N-lobe beta barrel domain-containing protein n=1 Tax=Longimonas halophila TaxID=1469170 RepID=A0A2H3NJP1_9BACT|nr:hypothetical protein [Longimonas halophila]PEN05988.1 hypothetical protein CRI93_10925 [Longimonas halophila]
MQQLLSVPSYHSKRAFGTLLLALALVLGLTACDSSGSNDDDNGSTPPETVNMSIGGTDVELNAFFATGTDPETNEEGFLIYLTEADDLSGSGSFQTGNAFGIIGRLSPRPETGTYTFADLELNDSDDVLRDQFGFVYFEGVGTQDQRIVLSSGGTIELTTSNSSRVAGSFDITGTALTFSGTGANEEEVSIEGNFDAASAPFFIPDDVDF